MKRLFKKLLPVVIVLGFLTACEDVPAPYYLLQKIIDSSVILDESFANSLAKWTVYNETDDGYEWANQYSTAYISGYQNSVNKATKSWLISPAIDLSDVEQAYLTFEYVLRFKRASTKEKILVSSNYAPEIIDGVHGTPLEATWYDLEIPLSETANYNDFNSAGAQLPSEVMGQKKVYIAFYYEAPANEASTWEVKNLLVKEGEYEGGNTPKVEAIFYSTLLGDEAGFTHTPITTPTGEFQVWKNSSSYGWVATSYDAENSTSENKIYYPGESWLISPVITLPEGDSYLSFMHALNYKNQDGLGVFIRMLEPDATTAGQENWTELEVTWPGSLGWTFISSGDISLTEFGGHDIQIGFKYTGFERTTATWEIKNFGIYEGTGEQPTPIETEGSGTKEDPYTVADALKIITSGAIPANEVYVKGVISQIDEVNKPDKNGKTYGNAIYYISDNGTTATQLEVYRGKGLGGADLKEGDISVGDEVIVVGQLVYYNNKTPEFTAGSKLYMHNGEYDDSTIGTPSGSGTKDDPYNVAAVLKLFEDHAVPTSAVYVHGFISRIKSLDTSKFTRAQYYISDDGKTSNDFYVYNGNSFAGADFTSDDEIKVGDEVIVCGTLTTFNSTNEFAQGSFIYMHNGEYAPDVPEAEPKGSGTLEDPYNAAAATKLAQSLAKDAKSDVVYVYGKVATIKDNYDKKNSSTGQLFGNATFYISDDGSTNNTFQIFQALYLGNEKYDGNGDLLKQGDDVIICGKLTNYNGNTPETAKGEAYLYSLNGNTAPTPPVETGTYDNPWTVADVQSNYNADKPISSYVTGYIVGYVKGSKYEEGALFGEDAVQAASSTTPTNFLLGATPNVTSVADCIPVQLPSGEMRNGLNLKDHPDLIGCSIILYGSVEKFFQVAGVKSPSYAKYEIADPTGASTTTTIGTRPDATAKKRYVNRARK